MVNFAAVLLCSMTENIVWYKRSLGMTGKIFCILRALNSDANWFCCYLQILHFGLIWERGVRFVELGGGGRMGEL